MEEFEDVPGSTAEVALPFGAVAQAQEKENARITLFRALRTMARMLACRGYALVQVGALVVHGDDATAALQQYAAPGRAAAAEEAHEIVMEARVPAGGAAPYTTAWAAGARAGATVMVIVIDHGRVDTMREIKDDMLERGVGTAILLSRADLTAYSKKFLADDVSSACAIQHFQFADLQAPIADHTMVPRHMVLNPEQAATARARFVGGLFPRLLSYDPMVRFLGLPAGAIVAIREVYGREQAVMTYFEVADA